MSFKRRCALVCLALMTMGFLIAGCREEPLPEAPMRSDDCLRDIKLDQLGEQLKRCDRVVAAFPTNPVPLNDRYLLRSLTGPDQERAACADVRRATALARQAKPGSLDPQLRTDLTLRLALCQDAAKPAAEQAAKL
jgi:hypothetical protein